MDKFEKKLLSVCIVAIVLFLTLIVITCNFTVQKKRVLIKEMTGIEMSYSDVFWSDPQIVIGRHGVELKER